MADRLYLDHAATTPMLPAARAAMVEALSRWANPSSPHAEGRAARAALEDARDRIKAALGWRHSLIFTSGASEAIAIALQRGGVAPPLISAVEHEAVARAAPGAAVLPVGIDGIIRMEAVPAGAVVAVQMVNNETGVIQPIAEVAAKVRAAGSLLLVDCAQSAGKLPLPDADFIAIAAHKMGGPPGLGALLVRDLPTLRPTGGQEQGYRTGTENLPAAVGMAAALETGGPWLADIAALRSEMEAQIIAAGGVVVGAGSPRLPTIGAYRLPGVTAASQLIQFDMAGIAVSAGAACSSGSIRPSHVLAAMGWDDGAAREVIRVSFGPSTTADDIERFLRVWRAMAARAGRKAA